MMWFSLSTHKWTEVWSKETIFLWLSAAFDTNKLHSEDRENLISLILEWIAQKSLFIYTGICSYRRWTNRKLLSRRPGRASTFVNPFFLCTLTTILIGGAAVVVAFTHKINELVTGVHKYVVNTQTINERCLLAVDVTTVQSFHRIPSTCPIAIFITWIRMPDLCESERHVSISFIYMWFHLMLLS